MTHVYDSWMDRKWIAAIKGRFSDREDLGREQAYLRHFANYGFPKDEVLAFFDLVESEFGPIAGLLRPNDSLREKFFEPVATRNPLRWAEYEVKAGDRQLSFGDELIEQMKKHGTYTGNPLPQMETIGDFVAVWCGQRPGIVAQQ